MVTNKNAAEAMKIHISCHCKSKFNSTTCNSNKKWNNKTCQCECKNYHKSKEDYIWNPSICICKNNNQLKSIADTSVTECDEIKIIMTNVLTKRTNPIAINVTITDSIKCRRKK